MNVDQQGWLKWHNKTYTGNINGNIPKYELQPMSGSYKLHQYIAVNIDIIFTNI